MGNCCGSNEDVVSGSSSRAIEKATQKQQTSKATKKEKIARAGKTGNLGLSDSKLKEIPSEVFAISNLRTLDLQNNQIAAIPEGITKLENLKSR